MTATLRAGVAKVDITPRVGAEIQGYLGDQGATGIFERLHAKALVFDDGREKAVLITSDLIGVSAEVTARVRQELVKKIDGLAPTGIMVSASHTHCGPTILPGVVRSGRGDPKYLRDLRSKFVRVVLMAVRNLEPVKIGAGSGRAFFNINRRLKTPQGFQMLPNPKGTCDHEVGVVRIDDLRGHPKAILMNFTCHPTIWGDRWISPDYPGFAQKVVEEQCRGSVIALFTNGATGDVRPCTVKSKNPRTFGGGTSEWVVKLGTILGREVLRVARRIETRECSRVRSAGRVVKLPLDEPMPVSRLNEEVQRIQAMVRQYRKENKPPEYIQYERIGLDWARNTRNLLLRRKFKPWVNGEIQLLQLGDMLLVGLPGEIFCDIGLSIKRLGKAGKCFIIGYANGNVGYVPTAKALVDGGYETDRAIMSYNQPSRFSSEAERVILDQVKELRKLV